MRSPGRHRRPTDPARVRRRGVAAASTLCVTVAAAAAFAHVLEPPEQASTPPTAAPGGADPQGATPAAATTRAAETVLPTLTQRSPSALVAGGGALVLGVATAHGVGSTATPVIRVTNASVRSGKSAATVAARARAGKSAATVAARARAGKSAATIAARGGGGKTSRDEVRVRNGSPKAIAQALVADRGWDAAQFRCLDKLWNKESDWIPTADNPTSSAYGIPQALPGHRMASEGPKWRTDPATQIRWGVKYIAGRYGTPCAAWAHSRATDWY